MIGALVRLGWSRAYTFSRGCSPRCLTAKTRKRMNVLRFDYIDTLATDRTKLRFLQIAQYCSADRVTLRFQNLQLKFRTIILHISFAIEQFS